MNKLRPDTTTVIHMVLIAVLGGLIYSNSLTCAFQFDDKLNIVDNPFIRNIDNLWPPSGARWFGLLTFALNYMAGGLDPVGYHLVNICIHILTALSVYFFVRLTLRTPFFSKYRDTAATNGWLAFACAVLFVAHPLQTQAVTYIVQRFASLATLLFMLSLDLYILARLVSVTGDPATNTGLFRPRIKVLILYAAAGLMALLSFRTKENAYTLPFVIIIFDLMFISGLQRTWSAIRRQWRFVAPLTVLTVGVFSFLASRHDLPALLDKLRATNEISRQDYLITQFRVIVTYIRLLFIPVNQTIDHHYRVYHSVFTPEIIASLAFIALLLALAVWTFRVSRREYPCLRLVSFGILWFFITLSVESSFIPIIDVMFEHRVYLPGIGAILAVVAACAYGIERLAPYQRHIRTAAACLLGLIVVVFSYAAHARNEVWQSELTLWSDVIAKKPGNPRGYNMVGIYYQHHFRIFDAISYFKKALEVDSSYAEARSNLGNAYILTGRVDEGLNELMITAGNNRFDEIDTGILYYNIAKGFKQKGLVDPALENLNRALRYIPNEPAVYALLGEVYRQKGMPEQSAANFRKARQLDPLKY